MLSGGVGKVDISSLPFPNRYNSGPLREDLEDEESKRRRRRGDRKIAQLQSGARQAVREEMRLPPAAI